MRTAPKLLVPALAALLALALAELAIRVVAPVPPPAGSTMIFEPDPHTGYRLKPGGQGSYGPGIPAVANQYGHRDDPIQLEKPAATYRVLVIGDSFTAGASVQQNDAYPQILERLLQSRYGAGVEVINAGVGGWGPYQYLQYYRSRGRAFQPDLVIVGFFVGNDTYDPRQRVGDLPTAIAGRRVSARGKRSATARLRIGLIESSHLARLALARGPRGGESARRDCRDFTDSYLALQRRRLERNQRPPSRHHQRLLESNVAHLAELAEHAHRNGAAMLVLLIPDENQINPALRAALTAMTGDLDRIDPALPQPLVAGEMARHGLQSLDLLAAFLDDNRCLYLNDSHWNPEGHALAAQRLAQHPTVERIVR